MPRPTAPDASLVAAVGDDEQFAVAASLIAGQLGFPVARRRRRAARTRRRALRPPAPTGPAAAATSPPGSRCSPPKETGFPSMSPRSTPCRSTARRDASATPRTSTEVRPETAEEVVAPDPVQRETVTDDSDGRRRRRTSPPSGPPCAWSASSALVAGGGARARSSSSSRPRRCAVARDAASADVSDRVVGGWDEYVDAAVDHGLPAPAAETRDRARRPVSPRPRVPRSPDDGGPRGVLRRAHHGRRGRPVLDPRRRGASTLPP